MESSDSGDKDESEAQHRSQMGRLVREEDFYRFVNNLSEDDYKLMRDNNLLGIPGESTEEELQRRLQLFKENSWQNSNENTGGGDSSDGESSTESLVNWLVSFEDSERVTSEQGEHQGRIELSQIISDSSSSLYSEIYFNFTSESSSSEDEYAPSTRLPTGESMENFPGPVENLYTESTFTRPSRSERSITETLMEVPATRSQRRGRSRSPDHRRTRARIESWSPPPSMSEDFQRLPQHVSLPTIEQPLVIEPLMEVPSPRAQRRGRSRSLDHRRTRARIESCSPPGSVSEVFQRFPPGVSSEQPLVNERTRARIESWSPPHSMSEVFQRLHQDVSSPTFEQPLVNATKGLSRIQNQETLRQHTTGLDLQNTGLFATPRTRNAIQRESSPHTTREYESGELEQVSPTVFLDSEVRRVHPGAYSQIDNIDSVTQITSETTVNTVALESEQRRPSHTFLHAEQADMRPHVSTIRVPIRRTLNTGLNDTTSVATESSSQQTMTDFSDASNLMSGDNDLDPSLSLSSQNMEKSESPVGRDSPDGSWSSGADSNPNHDYHSPPTLFSSSNFIYISSSSSSPMSSSTSSDENADTSLLMSETLDERSLPLSEIRPYSRPMTPISFDDSDSWASLDLEHFFLLSDDQSQSAGLTKAQIDNLVIRSSGKNDVLNTCSICITAYTEGNRLRVLPCSHEYHIHCIDRWLADNSTCPICRGQVVDSGERENSN